MDNTTTPPTENPDNLAPTEETTPPPAELAPAPAPEEETATAPETPATQPVVANHDSKKGGLKAVLITVLVLLLAAAAAGAVYMWQQSKVDDLNAQLTTAKAASTAMPTDATMTAAASTDPDLTKSAKLVKDFYAEYNDQVDKPGYDADKILSKYGNQNLAFYNKYYNFAFNPITCTQETLENYTVSGSKSTNGVATVVVKDSANGTITVRVVDQGGLKVDGITCPGNLGNAKPHDPES